MELCELLKRTPREVLATLTMPEFFAYVRLLRDRNTEQREAESEARRTRGRRGAGATTDDVVDLTRASDDDVAAAFGAKIVRVKVGAKGV